MICTRECRDSAATVSKSQDCTIGCARVSENVVLLRDNVTIARGHNDQIAGAADASDGIVLIDCCPRTVPLTCNLRRQYAVQVNLAEMVYSTEAKGLPNG